MENVHIPMIEDSQKIPTSACIKKYTFQFKHQAYWVYIGDENMIDEAEIPNLEALDKHRFVHNKHILKLI
ncbi:MAG: hypothetical protein R2728_02095 [Chitinophagales bacterium]